MVLAIGGFLIYHSGGSSDEDLLFLDNFNEFDGSRWNVEFNYHPWYGTEGWSENKGEHWIKNSVIHLRPDGYRGKSRLKTNNALQISVPFEVKYRVRFRSGDYDYRAVYPGLSGSNIGPDGKVGWPKIRRRIGSTDHPYGNGHFLSLAWLDPSARGGIREENADGAFAELETDSWLTVNLEVYENKIVSTVPFIDGGRDTIIVHADVDAVLNDYPLFWDFTTTQDYDIKGFDLDWIIIRKL